MSSLKIPAGVLRDLVTPVIPHACTDDMLPLLTTLRFASTSTGALTVGATDRFTFGVCRVEAKTIERQESWRKPGEFTDVTIPGVELDGDVAFNITVRQVKQILANLKPQREPSLDPEIEFNLPKGRNSVIVKGETADGYYAKPSKIQLELGLTDADNFPNLMGLFTKTVEGEREHTVRGYNGKYLAKFAAATRDAQPVEFHTYAKNAATLVTCGTHFAGAIMPVRIETAGAPAQPDASPLQPIWSDIAPDLTKEAKAS